MLLEQSPAGEQRDSPWLPILLGVGLVVILVAAIAFFLRTPLKTPSGPPPYAANVQLSDLKMATAQNFVGATVTYIEGTVTNKGDKTVTHVATQVTFKDSMGQVAQAEAVSLYVVDSSGPYPNPVDLSALPLAPGQAKPFRLTFEHVSADWDQAYPQLQVSDIGLK